MGDRVGWGRRKFAWRPQQHRFPFIVIAARAQGKPLALGSSRFLVLADVPYVENNTTRAIGTLVGTLVKR